MPDLLVIFQNLAGHLAQFERLLRGVFFVVGALLIIQSLRLAVMRSEQGSMHSSWVRPITSFACGVALLAFPSTTSVFVDTMFGINRIADPQSIFSYGSRFTGPINSEPARNLVIAMVRIIQFVGFIAIARGILHFNAAAQNGGRTIGTGITFVVAGVLAVNFPRFWQLLVGLFT
ncbi:MAG: hypothetical protein OXB95_07320 [Rhodobacteraceae bacterium]|nr:hypothetical protein [Paracoccaceae bacterium]